MLLIAPFSYHWELTSLVALWSRCWDPNWANSEFQIRCALGIAEAFIAYLRVSWRRKFWEENLLLWKCCDLGKGLVLTETFACLSLCRDFVPLFLAQLEVSWSKTLLWVVGSVGLCKLLRLCIPCMNGHTLTVEWTVRTSSSPWCSWEVGF